MSERIVITGMGTVNPLGLSVEETWENLLKGVSGVGPITQFDAKEIKVKIACEIKDFDPSNYMSYRDARRRDRVQQLATAASVEAINQAGLSEENIDPERVGVIISSAVGGLKSLQENMIELLEEGVRKISPFAITRLMINGAGALIAIDHGYRGPCFSVVSACSTGADTLGMALTMLRSGELDIAITGSAEAPVTFIGIAGFDRLGALSRNNEDYSTTPQPFDLNRNGLVIGEAAAVLVIETESHAKARGAEILAELAGYGATEDAFHITAPSEDGDGGARAILKALKSAKMDKSEVDYINAHGTATILNDLSETRAIKAAFGDLAYSIPTSSTKSMTGHTMGAAGSLEALICAKTVMEDMIPPTINYHTPDPMCDLDYVPNQARTLAVFVAISNSFGFGGHNSVIVIKKYIL